MREIEEGSVLSIDWHKVEKVGASSQGLVPVCVQDVDSREVLILAYANALALETALERKLCVLWSSSRSELWIKGATSGDYLRLIKVLVNCEQNSLLYLVRPVRTGACHTRDKSGKSRKSCYYRQISPIDHDTLLPRPPMYFFAKYLTFSSGLILGSFMTSFLLAAKASITRRR